MPGMSLIRFIDPFLLCLIAVVATASLLPVRGQSAEWFDVLADLAIVLLFFLHGAKLTRSAIVQGMGNWRLHLLVLASTFIWFPALGLVIAQLAQHWINPLLSSGLLFLTLLPSTVQSSIAFTAMARGNVAAAVCSASLSNLLGIILTPLLVGFFIHAARTGDGLDWHAVRDIIVQLLVPFMAGHLLRPFIGKWVDTHKSILMPVDRGSILLVVYSAFSAAVVSGIWHRLGAADLAEVLAISTAILTVIMVVNLLVARFARLQREDMIVLLFCGSKKSLVSGVPMAGALFLPAQVGMIVLPLMIFHQLQLFVCAWLAARFANEAGRSEARASATRVRIPQTANEIAVAARSAGIVIPDACSPGVAKNLALLAGHAAKMRGEGA